MRVWFSIENNWKILITAIGEWTTVQKEAVSFNSKAMNVIFNAVSMKEFMRISNVEIARIAWNILQTVHEGTKAVKINKLQQLTSRSESIRMSDDESFNLGEVYDQPKIVRRIFRSLTEDFRPKVTVIIESKDVDFIPIDELVGSLQSYESNLPKTNKSKSMALKSIDDCGFDDELSSIEITYLAKNFRNFLINNNRRARNGNNVDPKNVKKNDTTKNNNFEKSKDKVVQSYNNYLGQQCFGC